VGLVGHHQHGAGSAVRPVLDDGEQVTIGGTSPFEPEASLFVQLVSSRYERASLIAISNKPPADGSRSSASSPP
jgi:hypothetical protein